MPVEDLLRNYRARTRISQSLMAEQLGVSQSTYHKWESGKAPVPLELFPAIATLCQVSLRELLPDEFLKQL
ncbi:helix-turn-helix domain-containing protein [Telluribacter humicola]|uniref:helix-turn-helix domain-containing protein n=1 Tax=Telluribacter humicola TaxID=1720261 RepID=UPI001A96562D